MNTAIKFLISVAFGFTALMSFDWYQSHSRERKMERLKAVSLDQPNAAEELLLTRLKEIGRIGSEAMAEVNAALEQHNCMALNIYREAGNQSWDGKIAVAQVVLNRVENRRWPNTPCEVIYQRNSRACQFSWVCNPRLHHVRLNDNDTRGQQAWLDSRMAATLALLGEIDDLVGRSDHYHANYVSPGWRTSMRRVRQVGVHIFYEDPRSL